MSGINSVDELPRIEQVIRYLHAAAEYPAKTTWIKAINAGFFALWLILTMKAVDKYSSESTKTQKGHMQQQRQGVHSTQEKENMPDTHLFQT